LLTRLAVGAIGVGVAASLFAAIPRPPERNPIREDALPSRFSRGEEKFLVPPGGCESGQIAKKAAELFRSALTSSDPLFQVAIRDFYSAFNTARAESANTGTGTVLCPAGDPESLIYHNNAKALQRDREKDISPLTIAVVTPIPNGDFSAARETLFGVAQAQHNFNKSRTDEERLLEVIIVRDEDPSAGSANSTSSKYVARQMARHLVDNSVVSGITEEDFSGEILGVIGHYTSDATELAGEIYKDELPAISSFSTAVRNEDFVLENWYLRTVPNDAKAAERVVNSVGSQLDPGFKAYILFDSSSKYSSSAAEAFKTELRQANGIVDDKSQCDLYIVSSCPSLGDEHVLVLVPSTDRLEKAISEIKNFSSLDEKLILAGDAMYSNKVITQVGERLTGMRLSVAWHRDLLNEQSSLSQELVSLWGTTFLEWGTATSYDATQALIEAIDRALDDGEVSRSEIHQILTSDNFVAKGFMDSVQFNSETGERIVDGTEIGVVVEIRQADGITCRGEGLQYCLITNE
jgi:ABC-type branched-subunit amino acid transport system substrate-binding protein